MEGISKLNRLTYYGKSVNQYVTDRRSFKKGLF